VCVKNPDVCIAINSGSSSANEDFMLACGRNRILDYNGKFCHRHKLYRTSCKGANAGREIDWGKCKCAASGI
jgi:hypothetical protein